MSDEIPDTHDLVRYCKPSMVHGNTIKVGAFKIKNDNGYLSMNLVPSTGNTRSKIRQAHSAIARKIRTRPNGRLVIINVGEVKKHVYNTTGIELSIRLQPTVSDPTHAGIFIVKKDELNYDIEKLQNKVARSLSRFVQRHLDLIYLIDN